MKTTTFLKFFAAAVTLLTVGSADLLAQVKVGNNPTSITSSAVLDVESTNKGVIFPRVTLASATDQTTVSSPATGLLVYHVGTTAMTAGYYYWNGSEWRIITNSSISSQSSSINVGEYKTFIGTIPTGQTAGTLLSSFFPTQLPVIGGMRMDLAWYDASFYRPRIYNVSGVPLTVSYQTFATQVNENKTSLNEVIAINGYAGVDANDIVYWTTTLAEVETTNLQVQISANVWQWYEFKWWCMEIPNSNQKTIFLSVTRKA